jgi:hypothetical protein
MLRYGKLPATKSDKDLLFSRYRNPAVSLPTPPASFGYGSLIPKTSWGMFGNGPDPANPGIAPCGDCAWAGPAHETMLVTKAATGTAAVFTAANIISDYSAGTGYDPAQAQSDGSNPTDQGSDVRAVLEYRRTTGIIDATGNRHKIGAYLKLDEKNMSQWVEALYLCGVIGIGIECPDYLDEAFSQGLWDVRPGHHQIVGGHYICGVNRPGPGRIDPVTWGEQIGATEAFWLKYADEAWAILSPEFVSGATGKAPNGFLLSDLQADLAAINPG